jgi:hypothetical protein
MICSCNLLYVILKVNNLKSIRLLLDRYLIEVKFKNVLTFFFQINLEIKNETQDQNDLKEKLLLERFFFFNQLY